jgi:hypothetical protein
VLLVAFPHQAEADRSPVSAWQDNLERHAIVIGINRYTHLPSLQYADHDAERLSDVLTNSGYSVRKLINFDADPDYIKSMIVQIGEQMDAGNGRELGTLLITFSGHGYSLDGRNFLAMGGAKMSGQNTDSLSIDALLATMHSTGIGRQFLFVDACRNIPIRSGEELLPPFIENATDRGQGVLYSTEFGGLSYEDPKLLGGHGVFSHYLAAALTNAELYDDYGNLTLNSLYSYVRREVANHVFRVFDAIQSPYRSGESTGDLTIARRSAPTIDLPLAVENQPRASENPTMNRLWVYLGIAAGLLVTAAVVADDDSDSGQNSAGVTLVVPTP